MTQDNPSSNSTVQAPAMLGVRVEHVRDAFGIGTERPRLSWIVETASSGWHQTGYEIEEYDADGKLKDQTGRVESDQSVLVDWPFAPLSSRERIALRVRVWGKEEVFPPGVKLFRWKRACSPLLIGRHGS